MVSIAREPFLATVSQAQPAANTEAEHSSDLVVTYIFSGLSTEDFKVMQFEYWELSAAGAESGIISNMLVQWSSSCGRLICAVVAKFVTDFLGVYYSTHPIRHLISPRWLEEM